MDYSTHQIESMRAIQLTPAWEALVAHFADRRENTVARVFDPDCGEDELARLRAEEAGRAEVLDFFAECLREAGMTTRIEET